MVKCLVVDDNQSILDMIEKMLKALDYEVDVADNGALALDKYAKFKPDIVTLDVNMPVMDGYETFTRLLKMDKNAKVIILTASNQDSIIEKFIQKGVVGYLVKPFSIKDLSIILSDVSRVKNPKIVTFFSFVRKDLEESFKQIFNSDVEVILKDVATRNMAPKMNYANSKLSAIPGIQHELEITPMGKIGYITDVTGKEGLIISSVANEDFQYLKEKCSNNGYDVAEFFNIVNMKIISGISNTSHIVLSCTPIRQINTLTDHIVQKNDLTKGTFEVILDKKISLEIQVLFDLRYLYHDRL